MVRAKAMGVTAAPVVAGASGMELGGAGHRARLPQCGRICNLNDAHRGIPVPMLAPWRHDGAPPQEDEHARSGKQTQRPIRRLPGQRRCHARPGRRPAGATRARSPKAAATSPARQAPARGKLLPRDRVQMLLDPGTPFLELAPLAALEHVQQRRAGRRHHRRHRPRQRRGLHDRLQRRHGEGRHLLPDDGEEAPARAGDRAAEPPALHLPGRLRRRQPAEPGRGVPRPRPLRPHLLQPGQHERAGHPADRRGHGLVHRRRRLRAGDERRDHHREEPGHHLPGRPAAGEGRHRRGRQRRGPGRRRRAHAPVRRGRPPGAERPARAGAGARRP